MPPNHKMDVRRFTDAMNDWCGDVDVDAESFFATENDGEEKFKTALLYIQKPFDTHVRKLIPG
jgi:hypothetical protein